MKSKLKRFKMPLSSRVNYTDLLAAVNWEPKFFADIDESEEDSDYLREQQCCTSCGGYTGDLPGYYWIEDSDDCPICRASNKEEKWSEEVRRIMKREKLDKDEIKNTFIRINHINSIHYFVILEKDINFALKLI